MALLVLAVSWVAAVSQEPAAPIKLLFLGDNGHHQPAARFRQLQPVLASRGIELRYTDQVGDLNAQTLGRYDGLMVYANIEAITPEQQKALLDFVAEGKGFVPIHCASYCFLNSPQYIELVGAQFLRHETGVIRTTIAQAEHPIMKGFHGFESWDETYVHTKHNEKDRMVLEFREDGDGKEPWTWVRTHGRGRVFYTAWGHDERTWGNWGFQNLIERGIRWAVGQDPAVVPAFTGRPQMTARRTDVKPFEYVAAKVPFYPAGKQWGTTGEPINKMQKPLDPTESIKHLVTPVGLEPRLFASEPMISAKPISMNWDERGRLWVAVTVDYPNEKQPEGQGRDRILILEDTDSDGVADKSVVFADKLSIPTSLIFHRGGVIVHQAPQTLYLKDSDGDDVADERRVLFTGWSTQDTHAGPSNLRYGLDNWYYGIVGYSGFEGPIGGERQSFRTGLYRFQTGRGPEPSVSKFEFLRNTGNNSWGVGLSEEGILFGSTANGEPSVYLAVPNRYYESVRGWTSSVLRSIAESNSYHPVTENVRQVDWHGGFTSAAGHALYTARVYPREYWNRTAFVSDPTGHLTATFVIQPAASDFRSRNSWNLLASYDEWTAPIMAEVGPDGNVWVIDWYNYIVQHNPTPAGYKTGKGNAYETDLRDKKHGRIYRLVHTGRPGAGDAAAAGGAPYRARSLKAATPDRLVAALRDTNMFWRLHAQRLLVERGQLDVLPALIEQARDAQVDDIGLNPGVMHALWTIQGLGALDGSNPNAEALAVAAHNLKHRSAGVRRSAVQVLPRHEESTSMLLASGMHHDADSQVRLAALLALAELPPSRAAADALIDVLRDPANQQDRWIMDAATSAAARHDQYFLERIARAEGVVPTQATTGSAAPSRATRQAAAQPRRGNRRGPRPPADAAAPNRVAGLVAVVAEHYARGAPGDSIAAMIATLPGAPSNVSELIIAGWARGWPRDQRARLDASTEETLGQLLPNLSPSARGQLVSLASRLGSQKLEKYATEVMASFLEQVRDANQDEPARIEAAAQLIEFRSLDAAAAEELLKLLTPRTAPELARGFLEAVGLSEAPAVGNAVLASLGSVTPAVRPVALRILLSRGDWTQALLDGVEQGTIQLGELSLDQRQALAVHPNRSIAARARTLLARGGGLPNPDRQKVLEELLPLTEQTGNAALGKEVFTKQCAKCHTHSGEGTKVGPDLTGMAVHPKLELLTQLIDPSRSVEGNFRVYTIALSDGRVLTGLLASESKTAIELFDAEGKKHDVLREDIDEMVASQKSLMPEGFEKQVSPEEIVNLLEFLTKPGKYLPIDLRKVATIITTRGMFFSEEGDPERLVFPDWSPKTVEGVPFVLVDPQGDRVANAVMLYGPQGRIPPRMPRSIELPCNAPAKAIHFLSGISGWGFPSSQKGSVSMIVRLHYADGQTEEHELINGEHFADYIRRVDVPASKFAFPLRGQQIRYFAVEPKRSEPIQQIMLVKGPDATAPIVMAVTVETVQ